MEHTAEGAASPVPREPSAEPPAGPALLADITAHMWEIMQCLPTLSTEKLLHIHSVIRDLKSVTDDPGPPTEGTGSFLNLGPELAQLERNIMNLKKRNRLGTLQCEQCGDSLAASPAVRRGPSGSKSLCNRCGLRFSKQQRKQERTLNKMKLENLIHDPPVGDGSSFAVTAPPRTRTPAPVLPASSLIFTPTLSLPQPAPLRSSHLVAASSGAVLKWDTMSPASFQPLPQP